MPEPFDVDVIVVGMGPGGEAAASRLLAAGRRVAVVERELIGGECAYWACIPSKTLLRPPEVRSEAGRAARRHLARARLAGRGCLPGLHDTPPRRQGTGRGATRSGVRSSCEVGGGWPATGWWRWVIRRIAGDHVILATGSDPGRYYRSWAGIGSRCGPTARPPSCARCPAGHSWSVGDRSGSSSGSCSHASGAGSPSSN